MVDDLGAADSGGRRGFQAELRPRKAEELVSALLAATKEIGEQWSTFGRLRTGRALELYYLLCTCWQGAWDAWDRRMRDEHPTES